MRRIALDEICGWDSHNVTEDADLSFRLSAAGWQLGYINSPTQEEAVPQWKAWHYQRARWMKGFIQTWFVHMRAPFAPRGWQGLLRFFTLQLTIGLTLISALFHLPVMGLIMLIWGFQYMMGNIIHVPLPFLLSLCVSYGAGIFIGIVGAFRAGKPQLILNALFMPLYWLALFPPTVRAIYELRHKPFHWHKTQHGVKSPATSIPPLESLPPRHEYFE